MCARSSFFFSARGSTRLSFVKSFPAGGDVPPRDDFFSLSELLFLGPFPSIDSRGYEASQRRSSALFNVLFATLSRPVPRKHHMASIPPPGDPKAAFFLLPSKGLLYPHAFFSARPLGLLCVPGLFLVLFPLSEQVFSRWSSFLGAR